MGQCRVLCEQKKTFRESSKLSWKVSNSVLLNCQRTSGKLIQFCNIRYSLIDKHWKDEYILKKTKIDTTFGKFSENTGKTEYLQMNRIKKKSSMVFNWDEIQTIIRPYVTKTKWYRLYFCIPRKKG